MINCSAGKGTMPLKACFACALNGENACGYDYALLKSVLGDEERAKRRNEVHVTDVTGCLRKSWYDKCDPQPEYPHESMARWMGTQMHAGVEGSDENLDSELPMSFKGLVGRSDIVYKDGRIVDIKTTRWLYPDKLPYGSHALQVNIYAWMLRGMGRKVSKLQIQYIDASGPTKCRVCRVPVRMVEGVIKCPQCNKIPSNAHLGALLVDIPMMTDAEIEGYIMPRIQELQSSIETRFPPEREPGYLCAYCSAFEICKPNLVEGDE